MYEGYAPGGVAVLIECLTDNRNRAAAEVRTALTRNGGPLADPGSVSYVFTRKGVVIVPKGAAHRGRPARGGPGRRRRGGQRPRRRLRDRLRGHRLRRGPHGPQDAGIDYDSAEASFVPSLQVQLDDDGARKMFRVIDALEDSDDVQNVFANCDVSDEVLAELDDDDD